MPAPRSRRLVVVTKNAENPNYHALVIGARRIAEAAGAMLDWRTTRTPDHAGEQTELLAQLVAERPDGLIFAPADDRAMDGPVAAVNAAGIPIIGFVNRMPGRYVAFVGADDIAMGHVAARTLIAAMGGRGRLVLIEGPETAPTARDRGKGFRDAIAASAEIELLGTRPGFYLEEGGYSAMQDHLAVHGTIDGVLATNDSMALGAARAVAGLTLKPLIMGNNGTILAAEAIRDGRLLASMDFDGFKMGALTAMALLRHLDGVPVPTELLLPTQVIDRTNYSAWLVPAEQRPTPTWEQLALLSKS